VEETTRIAQTISGWLGMPAPRLPAIPVWEDSAPPEIHTLMQTGQLQGRTNASARLYAYALRNMLVLRVVMGRAGEHEQSVWSMLDEALGHQPTTPNWLHLSRYWCGLAPRLPDEIEYGRSLPFKTPYGMLCLGHATTSTVLVYPDARTENRADQFLNTLAPQLDWYPVQARYRLEAYISRAATMARNQQTALEHVSQTVQSWGAPGHRQRLQSITPLYSDLHTLETAYESALADLSSTEAAAQEVRSLAEEYRLLLMQCGLWDAAPSVWESRVTALYAIRAQITADTYYIDTSLRRMELLMTSLQTRMSLVHGERERLLVYVVSVLGLAMVALMLADTDPGLMAVRLLALIAVLGGVWISWQIWQQRRDRAE
jgi:hypothetical protein